MPRLDPLEALPLPLQVDAGAARIPLHEAIPDAEGQPAEFVAPDQFGLVVAGDLEHDRWDRVVAERMKLREIGELGLVRHSAADTSRRSSAPKVSRTPSRLAHDGQERVRAASAEHDRAQVVELDDRLGERRRRAALPAPADDRRDFTGEHRREDPGQCVPVHADHVMQRHHAPPNRSVLMRSGGCPRATSAFATVSTNPVGPHTNTSGSSATGQTAASSASASSRPTRPGHPDGADRVYAHATSTPPSSHRLELFAIYRVLLRPCRVQEPEGRRIRRRQPRAHHRAQRDDAGAARDELDRRRIVGVPDEVAAERAEHLEGVVGAHLMDEVRRHLAVGHLVDAQLDHIARSGQPERIGAHGLVAVLGGQAHVDVLSGQAARPAGCRDAQDAGVRGHGDRVEDPGLSPRHSGCRMPSPIPLLGPRVAVQVVAVLLPEAGVVALLQDERPDPLRALPEVQMRHDQPRRAAVLRDRAACRRTRTRSTPSRRGGRRAARSSCSRRSTAPSRRRRRCRRLRAGCRATPRARTCRVCSSASRSGCRCARPRSAAPGTHPTSTSCRAPSRCGS